MAQKYRAQILLEPAQHQALQQIALREGQSISEVAREVIRLGLAAIENDEEARWHKRSLALEKLNLIRRQIQEEHGEYQGDWIAEARAERQHQIDELWKEPGPP